MQMTSVQALITILAIAAGTQLTRWLPFWLFPEKKAPPAVVLYLGKVLPPAMMGLLTVYCFKNVSWLSGTHGAPELLASAAVVGLHLWKRNVLFSIAGGTVLYMVLVQAVFALNKINRIKWKHSQMLCFHFFVREVIMGRRWRFWPLTGFLTAAVLGTLAHFAYRWSGGALLAGVFCAVNESVWEHMKLLFFPVFLFTAVQFCMGERDGLLAARAVSVTAGLALIPTLYYTYTGIWGDHTLWADAAIFYLSAAVTFWMDDLLHRQRRLWKMGCQVAGLVWLWVLAFLFVWWTFSPPHIALFQDPLTGLYGIP